MKKKSSSQIRKIILIIVLVASALVAGAWIYWNTHKKQIIRAKLEETIREKTAGMYTVVYDDMEVDEVAGNLSLKNLRVGYDSVKYASLSDESKKPGVLLKLSIPEISISGVKTKKAREGKEIVGKKLLIRDPYIQLFYTNSGENKSRNIPNPEIYKQVLGELDLIKFDSVEISNALIVTRTISGKDSVVFSNTNIQLSDVMVDSLGNLDPDRFLFAKNMTFSTEKIKWTAKTGLYHYGIHNMVLHSGTRDIRIGRIDMDPQVGEAAFVKQLPYQADRLNIHFANIHIANVDFDQLMNEVLVADRLEAGNMNVKVYRDLRIPRDGKSKIGRYPHQMIMKAPFPFLIRQAVLHGAYVEYKEVNDISGQVGTVQFNNCTIKASNVTNEPSSLRRNNSCRVEVNGSLMNMTPMQATLVLPLGDSQGRFFIEGTTGGGNAVQLNKLTEPMGMARIRSGTVKSLHYRINGDNTHATGTVNVLYNDLKIDFLELDDDKRSGIDKKGVTSFVGNLFIKDDNPRRGDEPRTAQVNHPRDINRSFYNLIWKTIFEGINLTIGNKKKMKRP